ncbi:MAG TPA: 2-hydroxyacyl-CoA dehydratase family protein [bacterium]|nr:2-hydroxyacyl-CoA dehydratase family protein [bacterium]
MDKKLLDQFDRAWREPGKTITELKKKTGKKAVGLTLVDVPEELVHAAGALPVGVLPGELAFQHVDKHVQGFACSYCRSVVEMIESGELGFLDGLIVSYACDTTRCIDLILRFMDKFPFYECLRIPRRVNADGVKDYFLAELKRVGDKLSAFTGREITGDGLAESVRLYNEVRSHLKKLREAMPSGGVGLSEMLSSVRAALILPPEESLSLLREAAGSVKAGAGNGGKPRVVVAGKMAEPPGLASLLDQSGLFVVEDHLAVGGRWVAAAVPENKDPWQALVSRQLGRLPFAGIWDERPRRSSFLIERVQALGADGAVFLVQKFCEAAELDYPGIKEDLEKQGIPMLVIDTDFREASLGPVKTRVEAFAEMLKERMGSQ